MERNFYKDENGVIFEYEVDGSQDDLIGDKTKMSEEEVEAFLNPILTQEQLKADAKTAIQNMLDTKAQTHGYDDIISAASYASPTPLENEQEEKFRLEGNAFYTWRSACWRTSIAYITEVEDAIALANEKGEEYTLPTVETVLAQMPTLDL
jgi:hypothetical protein